jgi:hypothetical protein
MARASRKTQPQPPRKHRFQDTCVRRGLRELSARGTGMGVAVQRWNITAGVAGRLV